MQKAAACWNDMQDNENEKNRSNAKEVSGAEIFLRRMYGKRKNVLEISETRYYNKEEILLQKVQEGCVRNIFICTRRESLRLCRGKKFPWIL